MLDDFTLTILISLLETGAYLIYIKNSLSRHESPNPTSWFMFAYTAGCFAVVESNRHAVWYIIMQPLAGMLMDLRILAIVRSRGKFSWPEDKIDQASLVSNILLTVAYMAAWFLKSHDFITESQHQIAVLAFLICLNVSNPICYIPLIRELYQNPGEEYPVPWMVWFSSLFLLVVLTQHQYGWYSEFMIYPAVATTCHAVIVILALRKKPRGLSTLRP